MVSERNTVRADRGGQLLGKFAPFSFIFLWFRIKRGVVSYLDHRPAGLGVVSYLAPGTKEAPGQLFGGLALGRGVGGSSRVGATPEKKGK